MCLSHKSDRFLGKQRNRDRDRNRDRKSVYCIANRCNEIIFVCDSSSRWDFSNSWSRFISDMLGLAHLFRDVIDRCTGKTRQAYEKLGGGSERPDDEKKNNKRGKWGNGGSKEIKSATSVWQERQRSVRSTEPQRAFVRRCSRPSTTGIKRSLRQQRQQGRTMIQFVEKRSGRDRTRMINRKGCENINAVVSRSRGRISSLPCCRRDVPGGRFPAGVTKNGRRGIEREIFSPRKWKENE